MNARTPDLVTTAENSFAARYEREAAAYKRAHQLLVAEFMQALDCPMVGCVNAAKGRRYPVAELLFENLAFHKYTAQAAQAIAILMRDPAGRAICEQMAAAHADAYAEAE